MTEKGGDAEYVHDADAYASFCTEDAVLHDPECPGLLRGRDAVRRDMAKFLAAFPLVVGEQQRVLIDGAPTGSAATSTGLGSSVSSAWADLDGPPETLVGAPVTMAPWARDLPGDDPEHQPHPGETRMPQRIARTPERYERLARRLAETPEARPWHRSTLVVSRRKSPPAPGDDPGRGT